MPEESGPNPEQVRRFLTVLTTLSEAAWASSAKQELAGRAAYGWTEFSELELASYRELGEKRASRLLATIGKRLKSIPDGQQRHRASLAALALALAGQLTLSHFAANYAAFNEAIPVSVLGPGSAPILEKTPTMSWFRFVTRLVALEAPGWARAADAALQHAYRTAVRYLVQPIRAADTGPVTRNSGVILGLESRYPPTI
jgi:hypothetical protein